MLSRKSFLQCMVAAFFLSSTPYAAVPITPQLQKQLQQIVDDYYQSHHEKEQFTGIAASVLVPTDKQIDPKDIHTFVAGTIGFAPYTQAV
ncbi:MAG: hypothetical protein EPN84_09830, partial [Legionella sp.]